MTQRCSPLIEKCLDAFWSSRTVHLPLDDCARLIAVVKTIAEQIEAWAPDPGLPTFTNRIHHDIAERLLRASHPDPNPEVDTSDNRDLQP